VARDRTEQWPSTPGHDGAGTPGTIPDRTTEIAAAVPRVSHGDRIVGVDREPVTTIDVATDQGFGHGRGSGTPLAQPLGMTLFPNLVRPTEYRATARRQLQRVSLELEFERARAQALARAAVGHPELALRAGAAEVRVAALRAQAAQLRRAAGRLDTAA
jgi:hypothetical protein